MPQFTLRRKFLFGMVAVLTVSLLVMLGGRFLGKAARFPPMASPNSPTCGHPKFPRQDRLDYDDSVPMAMRAAASLSR